MTVTSLVTPLVRLAPCDSIPLAHVRIRPDPYHRRPVLRKMLLAEVAGGIELSSTSFLLALNSSDWSLGSSWSNPAAFGSLRK